MLTPSQSLLLESMLTTWNVQFTYKPLHAARIKNAICLQDQEDLDEARKISAFNRRRRSGDIRILEEELRDNLHTMEASLLVPCHRHCNVRSLQLCMQPSASYQAQAPATWYLLGNKLCSFMLS